MEQRKFYAGIERMRFLCAILVIAIHTSPLGDWSETANFIATRIVGRVAVPFFWMATGFFTLSRYREDNTKRNAFLRKTALVYGAAILFYLPVNVYAGYFQQPNLLAEMVQDVLFDGTLYHLWYLPAAMIGMVIAWWLAGRLDYRKSFFVAFGLYAIGLLGDSYYGLTAQIPPLEAVYSGLFSLFDYTRNGLFFAPLFLLLGGFIADQTKRLSPKWACIGFFASFALLFIEAMTLHANGLQRHDSMYIFLVPCMYFLFLAVLGGEGKERKSLRTAPLLIYLVHPMAIVVLRGASRFVGLSALFVENDFVHFAMVTVVSVLFGVAASALFARMRKNEHFDKRTERAYIEINVSNLRHNIQTLQNALPVRSELMAVVKAEAYGHSAFLVAREAERMGAAAFAVATIEEGIRLRRYGIRGTILILGFTDVHRAKDLKKYRLTQTLIDGAYAEALHAQGIPLRVHIAIDTGMHRLGLPAEDTEGVSRIFQMRRFRVEGIFTHFASSEGRAAEDIAFTNEQMRRFYALLLELKKRGIDVPKHHVQSSYGLLNYPAIECDYARIGIALYGVPSVPGEETAIALDLRPVLALKAKVALVRFVQKGESVGYDRAFYAERDTRIAILPIGYGDGFPRSLSYGRSYARIRGELAPIVGKICMDQLAIDVTAIEGVRPGDTAVLLENCLGSELSVPAAARRTESISNELLSRLGRRLPAVPVSGAYGGLDEGETGGKSDKNEE